MDTQDWATVYTLADPIKAEIIKNALEAEGMRCNLDGINQAAETGLTVMEIKVQVSPEDAEPARKFIVEHERTHAAAP